MIQILPKVEIGCLLEGLTMVEKILHEAPRLVSNVLLATDVSELVELCLRPGPLDSRQNNFHVDFLTAETNVYQFS